MDLDSKGHGDSAHRDQTEQTSDYRKSRIVELCTSHGVEQRHVLPFLIRYGEDLYLMTVRVK